MEQLLTSLIALSPSADRRLNAVMREKSAKTLRLVALPHEVAVGPSADLEPLVAEFAEQFSTDVSAITAAQREEFLAALGRNAFRVAALMFIADFVPRVRAGFAALGLPPVSDPGDWDRDTDPTDLLLNRFASTVGALRELDPVMTEVVRLRGAAAHNCRLCKSLREGTALDAGGNESMYSDIELYESSQLLDERHKAALRYVDALVWTPWQISADVVAGVRAHFSDAEATEITLDVMRNAINKIAVALGGDAPRVAEGTERYLLGADGQPVFS
ncbi:carboxymuconolactone decarboxylase family protein [Mycobacterium sp. OTB74]|uniref:carboxymuconolactone decarboxylase family protein n=1 Tax=Mycobacterium sp. OTB74 TaxID=1853452 RepID=UPI002476B87C|nr:carboxymuconolactone decarboxylase family protein [Mycobacterium sp. OTB74]MDH6245795.1 alkylhydroperoxidase family enzyme [Mycobacterium sp. OTB74]